MSNLCVLGGYPDVQMKCLRGSTFVSLQVKKLAKYFDNVYVISHRAWIPGFLRHIPFIPTKVREYSGFINYTQDNIQIFFPKYPPWLQRMAPHDFAPYHQRLIEKVIWRHKLKFDWLHGFFSVPMGVTAAAVGKRLGVHSLLTIEENDEWFQNAVAGENLVYMNCWRDIDNIVVVNPKYIDLLASINIPKTKISYIPNGFDESLLPTDDKVKLRGRLGIGLSDFVFCNVAFIEPKKDHSTLLEAFQQLRATRKRQKKLFIIGNGPLMQKVAWQIKHLRLSEDVKLLGSIPPKQVLEWISAADVFVNYSKAEGNPTVMFEALGCGRPYIGSDVGGVGNIITDCRFGLIAPPGDPQKLLKMMIAAMDRPWDHKFIQEVASQYTWTRIAQRLYKEVYNKDSILSGFSNTH